LPEFATIVVIRNELSFASTFSVALFASYFYVLFGNANVLLCIPLIMVIAARSDSALQGGRRQTVSEKTE
jgi:hypothetical protein